jgi:glycosyltransferase involved in cell wall biosynthesis
MEYSLIIPVYNEEESIRPLYKGLAAILTKGTYELIFIDDGSSDDSGRIISALKQDNPAIVSIGFPRNLGQANAFQEGFKQAQGEIIITIDADLQYDPRDIPRLITKLKQGFDVVCGWRKVRNDSLRINLFSKLANTVRRLFVGEKIHDVNCSLRAYRAKLIREINLPGNLYYMLTAILAGQGAKITEIEVKHFPRRYGRSKFGLFRRLFLFNVGLIIQFWRYRFQYRKGPQ